ncbi:MAG: UDP-N-acetylmuramoyl-L-alanyl-D-glutamate--2,6-diaminopimelate ligase [Rikenellaceae bacterium]
MKRLTEIFKNIDVKRWVGSGDIAIGNLEYDSRAVGDQSCFFALRGTLSDGHAYIDSAIERGARGVVCEQLPESLAPFVSYILVEDSHLALGVAAAELYDNPSRELKLMGITGTNGKTTTATLLYDLFRTLGYRVGLISTVVYCIDEQRIESTHTTPDAVRLQSMLRQMVDCGCEYCFMEVSSHAIVQNRISGLSFTGALFSNITHDHLDYHHTFAEYIKAKKRLFDTLPKQAFAITNIDDRNGEVMLQNCRASRYTYSLRSMASYRCKIVEMHLNAMLLRLDGEEIWVGSTGRFNAYNMLAIYSVARLLGVDKRECLVALSSLQAVCGRFETMPLPNGATAIIDYAHTPDALESVISTIEEIIAPEQQLIVVCGCGGERDREKRPKMAQIATSHASLSIFTSDNPRSEDPQVILSEMVEGVTDRTARYISIVDRREAIRTALLFAQRGDVVLIAGKGHEKYQIIGDRKLHFDDHEVVHEISKNEK